MDAPFQQAELLSVERPEVPEEAERLMARLVTQLLPRWLEDWRVLPEAKMDPKKVGSARILALLSTWLPLGCFWGGPRSFSSHFFIQGLVKNVKTDDSNSLDLG
jgi:hypothetical protein